MSKYWVSLFDFSALRLPRYRKLGHLNWVKFSAAYSSEFSARGKLGWIYTMDLKAHTIDRLSVYAHTAYFWIILCNSHKSMRTSWKLCTLISTCVQFLKNAVVTSPNVVRALLQRTKYSRKKRIEQFIPEWTWTLTTPEGSRIAKQR